MNCKQVREELKEHDVEPISLWKDYKNVWILVFAEISPSTYKTLIEEFNAGWIYPETENRISVAVKM